METFAAGGYRPSACTGSTVWMACLLLSAPGLYVLSVWPSVAALLWRPWSCLARLATVEGAPCILHGLLFVVVIPAGLAMLSLVYLASRLHHSLLSRLSSSLHKYAGVNWTWLGCPIPWIIVNSRGVQWHTGTYAGVPLSLWGSEKDADVLLDTILLVLLAAGLRWRVGGASVFRRDAGDISGRWTPCSWLFSALFVGLS
eukprot:TRINITY_DN9264_c0_g1_i1.p1 TRINITY_DN9264_c0_g1~~TRINITY_DN9264_c0_g1_i1.p1  ORF type:complete len:200 (-),score=4.01 TRINITY_DN9264_c0_g1_i1:283-882(-)